MNNSEIQFADVSSPEGIKTQDSMDGTMPDLVGLKIKIRKYSYDIESLRTQSNSVRSDKNEEFWRATEDLAEKKMWIEQDIEAYETIGAEVWKEFSKEMDQSFRQLENDYRRVLSFFE